MDRLDAMAVFASVVETGSLSAAGRRLGMPLATVSRKISELEAHLQTRLLTRTSRRVALTDAGSDYIAACRRILEDVAEAERAAAGEYSAPRGALTVAAPLVFGRRYVLPIVTEFLNNYREIDVRLALSDRAVNLIEEAVDVAVRVGELPDSSLMATRVGEIRRIVCASPEYFAARGAPRRPEDLAHHDCVTFEGVAAPHLWRFGSGASERTVPVRSRLVVNTAEAAADAAVAGLGVARLLCYQAANSVHGGGLQLALEAFEPSPSPVHIVYPSGGRLPQKLRAFLDFAAPRLRARMEEARLPSVRG
jgi:DNA-binding transcriptional LysR family regulator